jgi:RNA polymerase sigma-70 factor (ECF subfamily)
MDLDSLMAAYRDGDAQAFSALFAQLAARVHRFFMRCFGETAVADDLLQQTFLKVHRARGAFRGAGARAWIFAIAARVRLDEYRRRRRIPEDGDDEALARAPDRAAADRGDVLVALDRARRESAVSDAINSLPESQRVILHLHRVEGMTFAEIARVLDTTEGAVKLRAFRAYGRLRKLLAPLIDEPAEPPAAPGAPQRRILP